MTRGEREAYLRGVREGLDEYRDALMLARDALDGFMGDSDLDDDGSLEMRAMQAINRALRAGGG
jgi:hypothetical protein